MMPNGRDHQNQRSNKEQPPIETREWVTEGGSEERGRIDGPPKTATDGNASKQWQPPKKETTPNNRPEKK